MRLSDSLRGWLRTARAVTRADEQGEAVCSGGERPRPGLCMASRMLISGSPWAAHVLDTSRASVGTAAACCCGSEPCTEHRALCFTHSFPLGEGTDLLPKKLSPALRDLAEAQEIALLSFSLGWVVLTASEGGCVFWRERRATWYSSAPSLRWAPVPLPAWCKGEMTFQENQTHLGVKHLDLCTRHCVATLQITHVLWSCFFILLHYV